MGAAAARAKQKGPEDLRKQKRPGGPQRTKKGPQTLTGRIWDIRHISCLKKRCDLSVSAGTLSIAQFVRSYNPILEIYPNFFLEVCRPGKLCRLFSRSGRAERTSQHFLSGGRGRSSGEQRDRPRKRRRAFRAKASRPGVKAGKVIHIGGDFDGGRGNVIFRRRAKAGRCSKQRGNPHKLEEERGIFSVILETQKGLERAFSGLGSRGAGLSTGIHTNRCFCG